MEATIESFGRYPAVEVVQKAVRRGAEEVRAKNRSY